MYWTVSRFQHKVNFASVQLSGYLDFVLASCAGAYSAFVHYPENAQSYRRTNHPDGL